MDSRPNLEHDIDAMTDLARIAGRYRAALISNGISEALADDLIREWHGRHVFTLGVVHDVAREARDAAREVRSAVRNLQQRELK